MATRDYRVSDAGAVKQPGKDYDDPERYLAPGETFSANPTSGDWSDALPELVERGLVIDVKEQEDAVKAAAKLDAELNALTPGEQMTVEPPIPQNVAEPPPPPPPPAPKGDEDKK